MILHNTYIVTKKFVGEAICGDIALPYGTKLGVIDGFLVCPEGPVCAATSQNAYEHFSQDDDGRGLERGKLVQDIMHRLRKLQKQREYNERYYIIWCKIWADARCQKYKRQEHADHWIWNYDFYNAEIDDLKYIRNLVMKG